MSRNDVVLKTEIYIYVYALSVRLYITSGELSEKIRSFFAHSFMFFTE